ncbi:MAG: peptidyl-prolyl cis-trans isomerase A (cyclophilin A) [Lentimonas sp.]|jgi:peptidyl-prolyl cis-trans isomerase A (cyclophilin A)
MKKLQLLSLICFLTLGLTVEAKDKKPKLEKGIYAEITTSKGVILIQLEYEKTPMTVASFVGLAEGNLTVFDSIVYDEPFYNGLKFHRVIADFMIQGGDPEGTGSGGPKYRFFDEFNENLKHDSAGILSMANSGPATNGSQFFITHKATNYLDNRHTVFGHVIMGQNVIDAIEKDDIMETVKIIRKGRTAKKWDATEMFMVNYNLIQKIENERLMKEELAKKEQDKYVNSVKDMSQEEFTAFMFSDIKKKYPTAKQLPSGLVYILEKEGEGTKPVMGNKLTVDYKGSLRSTEEKFDASYDRGEPMSFKYREQRMIAGFEEGLSLMGEGGKIKIFIPYFQAYGPQGRPGTIPPYSDLIFDIEILEINAEGDSQDHDNHDGHNH